MKKHLLGFAAAGVALAAVAVNASGVLAASSGANPPAPTDVVATLAEDGVQLEWQIDLNLNKQPTPRRSNASRPATCQLSPGSW